MTDRDFAAVEGLWLGYQVISQTPITGGSTLFFPYDISLECNASFTNLYPANASIFITTNDNSSTEVRASAFNLVLCVCRATNVRTLH